MAPTPRSEITLLLERSNKGDHNARDKLIDLLGWELRRMAAIQLSRERNGHSLQTTELVNSLYVRMLGQPNLQFKGRSHFFAIAATTMRRVLIDGIRKKRALKNGGDYTFVPLIEGYGVALDDCSMIHDLNDALEELEVKEPILAQVVELKFFGGRTEEEIAEIQGVCTKTVRNRWSTARAWLLGYLGPRKT